jgi:hypothetical protein
MNPDIMVYAGIIGLVVSFLFLFFLLFRRIEWFFRKVRGEKTTSLKLFASIRNLVLALLFISVFSMLLFAGFFMRAYHSFTFEAPVAEVVVEPLVDNKTSRVTITEFVSEDSSIIRIFVIKGDQWMLEGDILKWENWLNFFGFHTRYRLTRIRGRYLRTEDELNLRPSIFSLVEDEDAFLWRYLYEVGPDLPFVSTVYGNAVFQHSGEKKNFLVTISTSGFVAREISLDE